MIPSLRFSADAVNQLGEDILAAFKRFDAVKLDDAIIQRVCDVKYQDVCEVAAKGLIELADRLNEEADDAEDAEQALIGEVGE